MREITQLVGFAAASVFMSGQALSQSYWAVNDDGSTTVASNSGTGNDSYKFEKNVQSQYDQTLKIVITDSNGDEVDTIVWDTLTVVTITIGPGQSVAIQDPQDGDSKSGQGTYHKV